MARLLSHLVSGPGAGGLEKDFLHPEGDGHARPVREAADEGPRDLVRIAGLEGRREPLRPVRLLKGDVLGARGSRRDVRPLELVRLVARESQAERDPAVGLEIAQDSRRSRSEEHTSELQSRQYLLCRLLFEEKT